MPIRVLSSPSGQASTNETVRLLVESLPPTIEVVPFGFPTAIRGQYDVLHVHWPESLVRGRFPRRAVKQIAFVVILLANRMRRIPMVWTVHNEHPHEPSSRLEAWLLGLWERSVAAKVYMSYAGRPAVTDSRVYVIPRGDYRPHHDARPAGVRPTVNRVLQFGLVRRYKGIESLINAVSALEPPERPELVVAGPASDPVYAAEIVATAAGLPEVTVDMRFVPDDEVPSMLESCVLVVLPYREVYNSGVALLALTLGRPVLVPSSSTMRELAEEVGAAWVLLYDGELTAAVLRDGIASARAIPDAAAPDLSAREWTAASAAYAELYATLPKARQR